MRFLIVFLMLACTAGADTLAERMTALQGVTLQAAHDEPAHVGGGFLNLHTTRVTYYVVDGDTVTANTVQVIIANYLDEGEAAYWLGSVPEPLRPVSAPTKYVTARTVAPIGGYTEAQVKSFAQAVWLDAVPAAEPIIGLSVSAVDGKTVRVEGQFWVDADTRETRTYLLWLADVDGSVTPGDGNIKWQRVTEEGAP